MIVTRARNAFGEVPGDAGTVVAEVKLDFTLAFGSFRANWRAFVGAQLLGIAAFSMTIFATMGVVHAFVPLSQFVDATSSGAPWVLVTVSLAVLPAFVVLNAFLGSQFGLAFDVMSSGDEFAEVRGALAYFRRYWWRYVAASAWVVGVGQVVPNAWLAHSLLAGSEGAAWVARFAAAGAYYGVWFCCTAMTFPALTATGSLTAASKANLKLLRTKARRVLLPLAVYFLAFELPGFLLDLAVVRVVDPSLGASRDAVRSSFLEPGVLALVVANFAWEVARTFVGLPLLALVTTRAYNSATMEEWSNGGG
ncbi:MAG: hypothetical protein Kow0069_21990 [Promethearchaeota archaeon]